MESAFKRDLTEELGLRGTCCDPACRHAPYFLMPDSGELLEAVGLNVVQLPPPIQ